MSSSKASTFELPGSEVRDDHLGVAGVFCKIGTLSLGQETPRGKEVGAQKHFALSFEVGLSEFLVSSLGVLDADF